jgi:hypothetical protein
MDKQSDKEIVVTEKTGQKNIDSLTIKKRKKIVNIIKQKYKNKL